MSDFSRAAMVLTKHLVLALAAALLLMLSGSIAQAEPVVIVAGLTTPYGGVPERNTVIGLTFSGTNFSASLSTAEATETVLVGTMTLSANPTIPSNPAIYFSLG